MDERDGSAKGEEEEEEEEGWGGGGIPGGKRACPGNDERVETGLLGSDLLLISPDAARLRKADRTQKCPSAVFPRTESSRNK